MPTHLIYSSGLVVKYSQSTNKLIATGPNDLRFVAPCNSTLIDGGHNPKIQYDHALSALERLNNEKWVLDLELQYNLTGHVHMLPDGISVGITV